VIVLDACALESYFADEPAAEQVGAILQNGEQIVISAINLTETLDRLIRLRGAGREALAADLLELGLTVSDVDIAVAFDAAELRATHYRRSSRAVSIADCCAAAIALDRDAVLATSDPALLAMVHDEGGRWLALPDSSGAVWTPPTGS